MHPLPQMKSGKLTDFSSLLNMESVCHKSEIWVEKSHSVGDLKLELVSWVEKELDPSKKEKVSLKMESDKF